MARGGSDKNWLLANNKVSTVVKCGTKEVSDTQGTLIRLTFIFLWCRHMSTRYLFWQPWLNIFGVCENPMPMLMSDNAEKNTECNQMKDPTWIHSKYTGAYAFHVKIKWHQTQKSHDPYITVWYCNIYHTNSMILLSCINIISTSIADMKHFRRTF